MKNSTARIAIVLRTSGTLNFFRDVMINIIDQPKIDEVLLCSGFFQENFKGSDYQASDEKRFAQVCASSRVKITTVGIHNNTWKPSYQSFIQNMKTAGVDITGLYSPKMHWHAKIFIASSKGKPCFGIVGSSNITRNAFSTGSKYNNECDVFLWSEEGRLSSCINKAAERSHEQIIIKAPYKEYMNNGLSVSDMLLKIKEKVLNQPLQEMQDIPFGTAE